MPSLIELSGLLNGKNGVSNVPETIDDAGMLAMLAEATQAGSKKKGGVSAEKALQVAEKLLLEQKFQGAYIWARRAMKQGQAEKRSKIVKRAQEIIKHVRGSAILQALASLGDIDGIKKAYEMGLVR